MSKNRKTKDLTKNLKNEKRVKNRLNFLKIENFWCFVFSGKAPRKYRENGTKNSAKWYHFLKKLSIIILVILDLPVESTTVPRFPEERSQRSNCSNNVQI